jgi:hypothetical protein
VEPREIVLACALTIDARRRRPMFVEATEGIVPPAEGLIRIAAVVPFVSV